MRLLVSVRSADEASAALAGGADVIDAKEPASGALGAVPLRTLREIHTAVGDRRAVSAAIGDAGDEAAIEAQALAYAAAGAAFVKVGFRGVSSAARVQSLLAAALRGSRDVIAAAYADDANGLAPEALADAAARAGARGVLLDTADKDGPGLPALLDASALRTWVSRAHAAGLLVAVAGRLTAADLALVRDCGADIAGVRGAACTGGRTGTVSAERVRKLLLHL